MSPEVPKITNAGRRHLPTCGGVKTYWYIYWHSHSVVLMAVCYCISPMFAGILSLTFTKNTHTQYDTVYMYMIANIQSITRLSRNHTQSMLIFLAVMSCYCARKNIPGHQASSPSSWSTGQSQSNGASAGTWHDMPWPI